MRIQPCGKKRDIKGFFGARDKGYAAGLDAAFTEKDNPYRGYDHSKMWLDGFRAARAARAAQAKGGE
jgi:ribosome modulation factor